jgi:23S rRNA pseudouridine955/2504/2580 synthase
LPEYVVNKAQRPYELSRLDRYIRRAYGKTIPQSAIEKALRRGDVLLNGKKCKASDTVSATDSVHANDAAVRIFAMFTQHRDDAMDLLPPDTVDRFSSMIVYEDEDLIVINKPAGLAVQLGSKVRCAVDVMAKAYNRNARLVHRIDKDTSGAVILSKNVETSRYMLDLFKRKAVNKKYVAVVNGEIRRMRWCISKPLLKRGEDVVVDYGAGKEAITEFMVIRTIEPSMTVLEATLITGRTHQIRVHLASINCPVVGDKKYGGLEHKRLCLHAHKVLFTLRSGKHVQLMVEIPECFWP